MQTNEPGRLASPLTEGLGLAAERDAVLAQLDDRTNQTWVGKRARWAALVRAQDAEIERLRMDLQNTRAEAVLAVAAERERIFSHIRGALGHAEAGYEDVAWRSLASLVGPNVAGEARPTAAP